jgi:hypothetical protein
VNEGLQRFQPRIGNVAGIFECAESIWANTRLWFGVEEDNYQLTDERRQVLFAPCATRIYSASSNSLAPGQEVPTNYAAGRVMSWWNDHYEEVARYEPEYERLNEYIKWSTIVCWLEAEDRSGTLSFLQGVYVERDAWFPDWVRQRNLRYREWDAVGFFSKDDPRCSRTEAMPILKSGSFFDYGDAETSWYVAGGVSGASPSKLKARPTLAADFSPIERLTLRGAAGAPGERVSNALKTGQGTITFDPATATAAKMKVVPAEGQAVRGTHGDLRCGEYSRTIHVESGNLRVETSLLAGKGGGDKTASPVGTLGDLSIRPTGNGFQVRYQSRDVDIGQALARDLSTAPNAAEFLARDPRLEAVIDMGEPGWLVKPRDSEHWLKLAPDQSPTLEIPDGFQSRIADDRALTARTQLLAWFDSPAAAMKEIPGEYLHVSLSPVLDGRPEICVLARGPPVTGKRPVELRLGDATVHAQFDPETRMLSVREGDLPQSWTEAPQQFINAIRESDIPRFQREVNGTGTLELGSAAASPRSTNSFLALLDRGDYAGVARKLVENPSLKADLLRHRERNLADITRQLRSGRPTEALMAIDRVLPGAGEQIAELRIRQGLAELARSAHAMPDIPLPRTREGVRRILNDVSSLYADLPAATKRQRQWLRAQCDLVRTRDLQLQQRTKANAAVVADKNGKAVLQVELAEAPAARSVDPATLEADRPLYLDDTADFHNRDFMTSSRKDTVQQCVTGGARLYVITKTDPILAVKPGRFRIAAADIALPLGAFSLAAIAADGDDDDDDDDEEEKARSRFAPLENQDAEPVYLLVGPETQWP